MNKAEEFVEAYLKKSKFDDEIIEYAIILDMMDEYAQQVSIKFHKWYSRQENWQRFLSKDDKNAFNEFNQTSKQ